jgi:hypothetical protein
MKNPDAVSLGKLGGSKGGFARAAKLSIEERRAIATCAARTRWGISSEDRYALSLSDVDSPTVSVGLHPLIVGLFAELPKREGEEWGIHARRRWLQLAASIFAPVPAGSPNQYQRVTT